jgi:hypothetical protein
LTFDLHPGHQTVEFPLHVVTDTWVVHLVDLLDQLLVLTADRQVTLVTTEVTNTHTHKQPGTTEIIIGSLHSKEQHMY